MHSYLRSIGFGDTVTSEYEVQRLLDNVFQSYEHQEAVKEDEGNRAFVELTKFYGPDIGIKLCGELDGHGFHRQFYFPFLKGSGITTSEDLVIERRVGGDSYVGVCDEGRVGVSLIFYVQNPADYHRERILKHLKGNRVSTTFSGLALGGTILLPLKVNEKKMEEQRAYFSNRTALVSAAKNGNQEAIESLTLEDMDLYNMISRRVGQEDVLSIVDTYFMPFGMECDQYQILGTINFYTKVYNEYTREAVYQMNLECNGMIFDVCINARDLLGDPEVGRRFKGNVWLQGNINFS